MDYSKYFISCKFLIGSESCQTHWSDQSSMAGNPEITNIVLSVPSVSSLVVKETLYFFSKVSTTLLSSSAFSMYRWENGWVGTNAKTGKI